MQQKILVIAAHPDDEVLGCGGTIAKLSAEGNMTAVLILGAGIESRNSFTPKELKVNQKILNQETKISSKILGISKMYFKNFPDQQYDSVPFLDIVKVIEEVKNDFRPDIVFTHHYGDLNFDHRLTFQATLTAARPMEKETIKSIYSFEIASSTEWGAYSNENVFAPNYFVEINNYFDKKLEAMKAYKSELREFPHPRSLENIKLIASKWGVVVGRDKVEAFKLIRAIK